MNLWDKGFEPDQLIEQFTVGADRDLDLALAPTMCKALWHTSKCSIR